MIDRITSEMSHLRRLERRDRLRIGESKDTPAIMTVNTTTAEASAVRTGRTAGKSRSPLEELKQPWGSTEPKELRPKMERVSEGSDPMRRKIMHMEAKMRDIQRQKNSGDFNVTKEERVKTFDMATLDTLERKHRRTTGSSGSGSGAGIGWVDKVGKAVGIGLVRDSSNSEVKQRACSQPVESVRPVSRRQSKPEVVPSVEETPEPTNEPMVLPNTPSDHLSLHTSRKPIGTANSSSGDLSTGKFRLLRTRTRTRAETINHIPASLTQSNKVSIESTAVANIPLKPSLLHNFSSTAVVNEISPQMKPFELMRTRLRAETLNYTPSNLSPKKTPIDLAPLSKPLLSRNLSTRAVVNETPAPMVEKILDLTRTRSRAETLNHIPATITNPAPVTNTLSNPLPQQDSISSTKPTENPALSKLSDLARTRSRAETLNYTPKRPTTSYIPSNLTQAVELEVHKATSLSDIRETQLAREREDQDRAREREKEERRIKREEGLRLLRSRDTF